MLESQQRKDNAIDCSKQKKSKVCRFGYVRVVRSVDDKKHTRPQVYEGDLMDYLKNLKERK